MDQIVTGETGARFAGKKIAIIGTGIMGHGMAVNFLKHGHKLFVWNRSAEKVADLVAHGAEAAVNPKEAVEQADIIFEVTANDESSRAVWMGEQGILAGAHGLKVLVASATLSVSWIDELAQVCSDRDLKFLDIPLTGGRTGAETGQLTLLAGGEHSALDDIRADLSSISKKVLYFGRAGSGMRYKLILNMMQGIYLAVFGEAMRIAESAGMDRQAVGDALAERFGDPPAAGWQAMQDRPGKTNFSVQWITKDLEYCKQLAKDIDSPFLDDALERFHKAMDQGFGEQDWTRVLEV